MATLTPEMRDYYYDYLYCIIMMIAITVTSTIMRDYYDDYYLLIPSPGCTSGYGGPGAQVTTPVGGCPRWLAQCGDPFSTRC